MKIEVFNSNIKKSLELIKSFIGFANNNKYRVYLRKKKFLFITSEEYEITVATIAKFQSKFSELINDLLYLKEDTKKKIDELKNRLDELEDSIINIHFIKEALLNLIKYLTVMRFKIRRDITPIKNIEKTLNDINNNINNPKYDYSRKVENLSEKLEESIETILYNIYTDIQESKIEILVRQSERENKQTEGTIKSIEPFTIFLIKEKKINYNFGIIPTQLRIEILEEYDFRSVNGLFSLDTVGDGNGKHYWGAPYRCKHHTHSRTLHRNGVDLCEDVKKRIKKNIDTLSALIKTGKNFVTKDLTFNASSYKFTNKFRFESITNKKLQWDGKITLKSFHEIQHITPTKDNPIEYGLDTGT